MNIGDNLMAWSNANVTKVAAFVFVILAVFFLVQRKIATFVTLLILAMFTGAVIFYPEQLLQLLGKFGYNLIK